MFKIWWTLDLLIPISWEHYLNDFLGDHAKTCMTASTLLLSVELLFLLYRPFNTSCTVPLTFSYFYPCFYPLFNNTSVTTYVHRMIISPPCLFNHMKDDEHVAMLFQCLLDHTQQKLYFCPILLLRNNVSKSVYINLRHSVVWRLPNINSFWEKVHYISTILTLAR